MLLECNNPDYLQANANTSTGNVCTTTKEVIEECRFFYFAGQDTTSAWLTWNIIVLSMHQDWKEKAREEVIRICGKNPPQFESMAHLKTTVMHVGLGLRHLCTFHVVPHWFSVARDLEVILAFRLKSLAVIIFANNELWGWIYEPRNFVVWYEIKKKTNVLRVEFTSRISMKFRESRREVQFDGTGSVWCCVNMEKQGI
ncbi:hypothetical protein MKX03_008901 [Papaver bracteatum]|nr:hypothetical protein MKX03_008901 [Papaver bracteatum]